MCYEWLQNAFIRIIYFPWFLFLICIVCMANGLFSNSILQYLAVRDLPFFFFWCLSLCHLWVSIVGLLFWHLQIKSSRAKFTRLLRVLMEDLEPLLLFPFIIWFAFILLTSILSPEIYDTKNLKFHPKDRGVCAVFLK